jgi:hypothetical protein
MTKKLERQVAAAPYQRDASSLFRREATASLPDSVLLDERTVQNEIPRLETDNEKCMAGKGEGESWRRAHSARIAVAIAIAGRGGARCIGSLALKVRDCFQNY